MKLLHRGSQFPNLGLFFNRRGYELVWNISLPNFTTTGWDHWFRMRAEEFHMECVFPAVPRIRHQKGLIGTTVKINDGSQLHLMPYLTSEEV